MRTLPHDIPSGEPRARAATVRKKIDAATYILDFGGGLPEIGYFSGTGALAVGQRIMAYWHPEMRTWQISAVGEDQQSLSIRTDQFEDDGYWTPSGATFNTASTAISLSSTPEHAFMLFKGVGLAQGATIPAAYLYLNVGSTTGGQVTGVVRAQDADTATAPTSVATADALTLTTANVAWALPATTTARAQSPDIKTVIQELVDRPGWEPGSDILIVISYSSGGATSWRGRWDGATPQDIIDDYDVIPLLYIGQPDGAPLYQVDAVDTTYTPGTPADWNVAPTEVASALDELASRLDAAGV